MQPSAPPRVPSSPLADSPTTSRSSKADKHELTPSRSRSWSSTTTRTVITVDHAEIGAVARCGSEHELGADAVGTFAHDRQPEVSRCHVVDVEARARCRRCAARPAGSCRVVALPEGQRHHRRRRVAGDVGERLLGDPVERHPLGAGRARPARARRSPPSSSGTPSPRPAARSARATSTSTSSWGRNSSSSVRISAWAPLVNVRSRCSRRCSSEPSSTSRNRLSAVSDAVHNVWFTASCSSRDSRCRSSAAASSLACPTSRALEIAAAAWSAIARSRSAWAVVKKPLVTLSRTTNPIRRSPTCSAAPSTDPAGPSALDGSSMITDS